MMVSSVKRLCVIIEQHLFVRCGFIFFFFTSSIIPLLGVSSPRMKSVGEKGITLS